MTRTQIQLPDELYEKARNFAAEREMSLAEVARRGIELFLARFPRDDQGGRQRKWKLPKVDCGGLKVSLQDLKGMSAKDESRRSFQ